VKLLFVVVGETDMWENEIPLYEAIVRRLVQLEASGATVSHGIMGFGSHMRVHRKGLFGVSDDRPVTILVADTEANIRRILPVIRPMLPEGEGLALLLDAEVV
jgi:PII-like signaling protein